MLETRRRLHDGVHELAHWGKLALQRLTSG